MDFSLPPEPLTSRQRAVVAIAALVCAASRFLALARSLWDWDEALFTLGMRDYDVTLHHPHPPGFPAYIAMARVARLIADSDFRALQTVNLIFALLVFPAVFFLARELRMRFESCVIAGLVFAFFPNVWFFGGGAFSDVPSIVLVCFAAALLLRGVRDRKAYWLGTFLLAVAMGIRPQNVLLGLAPGMLATRHRRVHEILVALLIGILVVGAAFGGAIYATGSYDEYMRVVREHADYISRVDSWRSPDRPPLWRLFDRFFFKQYQSPVMSVIASLLAIVSVIRSIRDRYRPMLWNALIFGPFALFAWVMLDRFSISRFSIGYIPMFALFAADGIRRITQRRPRYEPWLAAAVLLGFIVYTLPGLQVARTTVAPSVLAAEAVTMRVTANDMLYVGHTMSKFVDVFAPNVPYRRVIDDRALPLDDVRSAWLLAEVTETKPEGFFFQRERGHLWNIARRHYFEIVLRPLRERARFVSGWYPVETEDIHEWRWMSGRSVTILPPLRERKAVLRLHIGLPPELMPQNPQITIRINGRVVDRFRPSLVYFERNVDAVPAPGGQSNTLELEIDRTHTDNGRPLGLRVRYLAWGPS
jgi:Dolichyl-phosphate-mannose-protein mannosyltransferase